MSTETDSQIDTTVRRRDCLLVGCAALVPSIFNLFCTAAHRDRYLGVQAGDDAESARARLTQTARESGVLAGR